MGCRIIICENAYLPLSEHSATADTPAPSVSCGDVHLHLLNYFHARDRDLDHATEAMQGIVNRIALEDDAILFLATHNLVVGLPAGRASARVAYDRSDPVLRASISSARSGCATAIPDLLGWFWNNSSDLPPIGLAGLRSRLEGVWVHTDIWNSLRRDPRVANALTWLARLDPAQTEDNDFGLIQTLLQGDDDVSHADHIQAKDWAARAIEPRRELFLSHCGLVRSESAA